MSLPHVILSAALLLSVPQLVRGGCLSNVASYPRSNDGSHYIVAVGEEFEVSFQFDLEGHSSDYRVISETTLPGVKVVPPLNTISDVSQFTVNATYFCDFPFGSDQPGHLAYGIASSFANPLCDADFECCDTDCVFLDAPSLTSCGETWEAYIALSGCDEAELTVRELTDSGVTFNPPLWSGFRNGNKISASYQCPSKRGSSHTVTLEITDQYGGIDTCTHDFTCEWCLNPCACAVCAPGDMTWVCLADSQGGTIYLAGVHEIPEDESTYIYPTEKFHGTLFDCWCDPVCDYAPEGQQYICHRDQGSNEWRLTAVPIESRPGPKNDLQDYMDMGDGLPGTLIDAGIGPEFFDCWCDHGFFCGLEVSGRIGHNSGINGIYTVQDGYQGGRPYYHSDEAYMFYRKEEGAWFMGYTLGSPDAFAYSKGDVRTPEQAETVWHVWDGYEFIPDEEIRVKCGTSVE